jgi:hypothetical protein
LEELLENLQSVAGNDTVVTKDRAIGDLPIDSLDLVEWFYVLSQEYPALANNFAQHDRLAEEFFELSLEQMYNYLTT